MQQQEKRSRPLFELDHAGHANKTRAASAMIVLAAIALMATAPAGQVGAQSLFDWERGSRDNQYQRQEAERRSRAQRRADYCRRLEQRLVSEWRRNNQTRGELPEVRQQLREAEKQFRTAQAKAENRNCYEESFFFGRSLRRTPECVSLDREVLKARRQVSDLRERIERISRSGSAQSQQDALIAELARYGCGEDYERQYQEQRPAFFSFFDDRDRSSSQPRQQRAPSELPFATYRTMCVRQCDGFYFPVSFSTLPSQFSADEKQCSERCAAPTALFVYRNPGESVEQMVSPGGVPYSEIENAWLYRDNFIEGCSCDAADYSKAEIAKSMAALDGQVPPNAAEQADDPWQVVPETEADQQAASDQDRQDELIIRDVPEDDSFDPRRR